MQYDCLQAVIQKLAAVIQMFARKYKPENNDKGFCYSIQTLAPPTRRPVRNRRSGHSSATLRNRWLCQRTNRGKQYCGCVTVSFLILTFRHLYFIKTISEMRKFFGFRLFTCAVLNLSVCE